MKDVIRYGLLVTGLLFLDLNTLYANDQQDVTAIIKKMDDLYRSSSSYAEFKMEIVNPHWQRTLTMKAWTQGKKRTFIRIISPAKEEGIGTLRIGNEMWNYLPNTNKVIKIPPSMMMSSWMGSDFNNDDLVSEFTFEEDYTFSIIKRDSSQITVKCIPKEGRPIVWGSVLLVVRSKDFLPVEERYYDEQDNLMRTMYFKNIKTFDNRTIPSVMELIPENEKNHKTVLEYIDVNFDREISDHVFSLRNLRSP